MYAYMYVYWHCNLPMCVELFHTAQTIENDTNLKTMQGTRASLAEAVFAATEFWQFKKPQGWCTNWKLKAGIAEKMCFRRLLLTALGLMLPSNQIFLGRQCLRHPSTPGLEVPVKMGSCDTQLQREMNGNSDKCWYTDCNICTYIYNFICLYIYIYLFIYLHTQSYSDVCMEYNVM